MSLGDYMRKVILNFQVFVSNIILFKILHLAQKRSTVLKCFLNLQKCDVGIISEYFQVAIITLLLELRLIH